VVAEVTGRVSLDLDHTVNSGYGSSAHVFYMF